jgi:molybdenum cofactor biosynthesis enzyme MoaA
MTKYNHVTTIEVDEVYIPISIDFTKDNGGDIEIVKMTHLINGDAIAPDLLGIFDTNNLYNELHEFAADLDADNSKKHWPVNYNAYAY